MKAAGATATPCSDCSLFTLAEPEHSWTAAPVPLSLPLPGPLAPAGGHVPACCPCPALPVLHRPPVSRSDSSSSALCMLRACTPCPSCSLSKPALKQQLPPAPAVSAAAGELLPDLPFPWCFYGTGSFSEPGLCCKPQGRHLFLYLEAVPLILDRIVLQ